MRPGYVFISGPIAARASAMTALMGTDSMDDNRVEREVSDQHVSFVINADDHGIAEQAPEGDAMAAISAILRTRMLPAEFDSISVLQYFDRTRYRRMHQDTGGGGAPDLDHFIANARRQYHDVGAELLDDNEDDDFDRDDDRDDDSDEDEDDEGDRFGGGSNARIVYDDEDPLK